MKGFCQAGLQVRFFCVDIRRKPGPGAHVHPPTLEMEKEIDFWCGKVSSVETNDVVVLIFDPDSTQEARCLFTFAGLNIDHQASNFTQKFTPNKVELVIALLEIAVEHHHLGESHRQIMQGINAGQLAQHAVSETRLSHKRDVLEAIAHVQSTQKILVLDRRRVAAGIVLQVLKVGFDQRMHMSHLCHEIVLALYNSIDNVVERERGRRQSLRWRGPRGRRRCRRCLAIRSGRLG